MKAWLRIPAPSLSVALMLLACVCGGAAIWAAQGYLQRQTQQIEAKHRVPTVERIVAGHDLPAGTQLQAELLALRAFPADVVPSDSMTASQATSLLGMVLRAPLRAGDMIVPAHTQTAAARSGFSSKLAQGRRAVTLPVDVVNAVSGLLQPGDLIDLYVSFDHQRRRVTAPLLQGVQVLATGSVTDVPEGQAAMPGYATITLDVAPEDAVKLVAARQAGTLTAMLRSPYDDQPSRKAARGDLAQLLGLSIKASAPVRRPVVLYGNRAVRNPPALQAPRAAPQWRGVFDLPRAASLVRVAPRDASDAQAAHDAMPYGSAIDVVQTDDGGGVDLAR